MCLTPWGCSDGDSSGDEGSSAETPPPSTKDACDRLLQYCATDPVWSYYLSSASQCQELFECINDLYTGSCRSRVSALISCGEGIENPDQCEACSNMAVNLSENCPYPAECL